MTANYAVLDFAQRYRETLLYNIYVMGRNAIKRGNTDTWTMYPRRVAEVKAEIEKDQKIDGTDPRAARGGRANTAPTSTTRRCGVLNGAMRAATSSRRIRETFSPRQSSSIF